jgi:hypothetical protein
LALGAILLLTGCLPARAADSSERVLFEDGHIRFVEITRWPGERIHLRAQPYPAIIAVDASWPQMRVTPQADRSASGSPGRPPHDIQFPWCQTNSPIGAQDVVVTGNFPQHFYRIEYLRVDGAGFSEHWREWYPWILAPVVSPPDFGISRQPGPAYSAEFAYPYVYNAATAAPANHFVRYEDEHIQLVEVTVRPGETENMHGHPYRSVYANDGAGPTDPVPAHQQNKTLDPVTAPPWGGPSGRGSPPPGQSYPDCLAAAPEAPHQVYNPDTVPEHFFRLQYKRIDGQRIESKWHEWYPNH